MPSFTDDRLDFSHSNIMEQVTDEISPPMCLMLPNEMEITSFPEGAMCPEYYYSILIGISNRFSDIIICMIYEIYEDYQRYPCEITQIYFAERKIYHIDQNQKQIENNTDICLEMSKSRVFNNIRLK